MNLEKNGRLSFLPPVNFRFVSFKWMPNFGRQKWFELSVSRMTSKSARELTRAIVRGCVFNSWPTNFRGLPTHKSSIFVSILRLWKRRRICRAIFQETRLTGSISHFLRYSEHLLSGAWGKLIDRQIGKRVAHNFSLGRQNKDGPISPFPIVRKKKKTGTGEQKKDS